MKQSSIRALILLCVSIGLIFAGVFYATQPKEQAPAEETANVQDQQSQAVTLNIEGIYDKKSVQIETGETLLLLLERLQSIDPQLQLMTKSYGEMGSLVESLGGKTNGTDNQYWQFTVNGVAPMIGVSAYVLKPGEEITWQFTTSDY